MLVNKTIIPLPPFKDGYLQNARKIMAFLLIILFVQVYKPDPIIAQQDSSIQLARIKYRGGGDWYNDPSALKNLIKFVQKQAPISINPNYNDVAIGSPDLLDYPFAFITGHGTVQINEAETANVRTYLNNGGFLYVDDDYGLDDNFKKMMVKVYPKEDLIELPFDHPIYHQLFDFNDGLPKVHEHNGKPPQGFGIFHNGRLVLFYTYESNLADGWTNPEIHKDPASIRQQALKMGANILIYALTSSH